MLRADNVTSETGYCENSTDELSQVQCGPSDRRRSASHAALLATVSLTLLIVNSTAPIVAQAAVLPQTEGPEEIAPYLTPQQIVRIANGRPVNIVCLGQGSPTVILTAGLGGWSQVWYRIQVPLSHTTRVCAWDPAGFGFSGPSPEPQDTVHETNDLEEALMAGHIDGPFVLVGHSAGAFVALMFADRHQTSVAGMVLVDPSVPDQAAIRERVAPKFAAFGNGGPQAEAERLRQCATKFRTGTLKRGTPGFDECTAQRMPDEFSRLSVSLSQLNANPARLLTQSSSLENAVSENAREIINPHRNYGDMPLIVLTSGQHPFPPNMPKDIRQQAAVYFQALGSGHQAYAALSTRGQDQLVPDSGHFIQFDNPPVVLAAINSVLADNSRSHK